MSLHRRDAKRDSNEPEIVRALEATGWSVTRLSIRNGPDLLLGKWRVTLLGEVKRRKGKLEKGQEEWHAAWRGAPVLILRSVEDVIALNRIAKVQK